MVGFVKESGGRCFHFWVLRAPFWILYILRMLRTGSKAAEVLGIRITKLTFVPSGLQVLHVKGYHREKLGM